MEEPVLQAQQAWDRSLDRIERLLPLRGAGPALSSAEPGLAAPALEALISALAAAHRGERQRGIDGHWTFDANRLLGLSQALGEAVARRQIVLGKKREDGTNTAQSAAASCRSTPHGRGG